ncbi:hypothetical protein NLI96_g2129 [Meripilus lineatus]|uniref:Uncharacterized protein n=1 Tax=Meripilus lineatus TaxID=2056292 RepID=A0AAD5YM66_9APHY|nr:hypothetical protein NLI96_g2129 [Physisporinus lineatus]
MNAQVEQRGPTGSSPLAQSTTELSVASVPSADRVAQVDEDVIVSTYKSFPSLRALRARKDPSVVDPVRISTRSSFSVRVAIIILSCVL